MTDVHFLHALDYLNYLVLIAILIIEEVRHHRALTQERKHQDTLISRLMSKNLSEFTQSVKDIQGPSKNAIKDHKLTNQGLKIENDLAMAAAEISKQAASAAGYPVT